MLDLSISQKQNLIYTLYCIITILMMALAYHLTQPKWVSFRAAEKQYSAKNFSEAIQLYEKSLSQGATSINARLHLANSYIAVGEFPKAIEIYKDHLNAFPEDNEVRRSLAKALFWNGNLEESENEYKKVVKPQ